MSDVFLKSTTIAEWILVLQMMVSVFKLAGVSTHTHQISPLGS